MKNNDKEKKELDMKKIFFAITLVPYVIFLLLGIGNCINNSLEYKYLDLYALIEPLANFWSSIINNFNILFICLTFFVGYPIYYLVDSSNKKDKKQTKISKSFILYIISFIPYLYIIQCIISSSSCGIVIWLLFTTVPVYPIIFIFQLIYTIKKYKKFTPNMQIVTKSIIISIILLMLITSFISSTKKEKELNTTFANDKIVIEKYLIENFGEKHYKNMEIVKNNSISNRYMIKTPLLDYGFSIELSEDRTNIINSTFYKKLIEDYNITPLLNQRLTDMYKLPYNIKVETEVWDLNIDIKNYNKPIDINLLLDNCEYNIKSINIYTESLEIQDVTKTIKDFYINYSKMLDEYHKGEKVVLLLRTAKEDDFRVDILKPSNQENILTIMFWQLNNETVYVDLSE